ncbi:MAG TPA: hypothetical protein VED40_09430 [Azospirillaceae bacterium]|nr:hypothetical protein [Azospirillaceae bacterium]
MPFRDRVANDAALSSRIFASVLGREGSAHFDIHLDSRQIPTLGAGSALASGTDRPYTLMEREEINVRLGAANPKYSLDQNGYNILSDVLTLVNQNKNQAALELLISGKSGNPSLGRRLSEPERDNLLRWEIDQQLDATDRNFRNRLAELVRDGQTQATIQSLVEGMSSNQVEGVFIVNNVTVDLNAAGGTYIDWACA